ncbi:MAG: D-arginine dehydrogenase [Sphingomonadales bacterium]|jgi:D-arginine dehydrogenase|nr:D-arginine dehydrogenase [Sphingomonadales bacterium]
MTLSADVVIVGAGIAGAGLAAEIAGEASVLVIEAEEQPGYHSTGRSAAFWSESYGGFFVQPLTSASREFLETEGLLRDRRGLHLADAAGGPRLDAMRAELGGSVELVDLGREEIERILPGVRPGWERALLEPSCKDIDVAALHALSLARARRGGARIVTGARLTAAERRDGLWRLETSAGEMSAGILVDAAGAWADDVARIAGVPPLGIRPYRRTVVQLRVEPPAGADLPLVIDALGRFYFKPEAGGRIWLSPHDETPCEPGDCAPEEIDVALAIDRLEQVVDWKVLRVERAWAGLRSFAPDRLPVYGFDPAAEGFFWCAGQGGFGIQTAPAASALAAALLLERTSAGPPRTIDPAPYRPARFAHLFG